MIHILRHGDGAALVCVHPADGQVDHYRPLASELAWRGPILGIEAESGVRCLAELAAQYAEELAPHRPAALLGWALGGVIAAELSRVLVDRGHRIESLAVLDGRVPQHEMRERPTDRATIARFFVYQRAMMQERTPPPAPTNFDAKSLLAVCDLTDAEELERRLEIFMGLTRAFFKHEQRPVPIALDLFEAVDEVPSHPKPPTLGWEGLAPRIVKHPIAGTHFTLLAPRRCPDLVRVLDRIHARED